MWARSLGRECTEGPLRTHCSQDAPEGASLGRLNGIHRPPDRMSKKTKGENFEGGPSDLLRPRLLGGGH